MEKKIFVRGHVKGGDEGMRRGLDGLLLIKNKQKKNYPLGVKQEQGKGLERQDWTGLDWTGLGRAGQGRAGQGRAGQGRAGQGRAGYIQGEPMISWHRTANTRRL